MTTHHIDATPEQIAAFERGATDLWLPMKPQPKHGPVFQIHGDKSGDWYNSNDRPDGWSGIFDQRWKPPYQPGHVLAFREEWASFPGCDEIEPDAIRPHVPWYRNSGEVVAKWIVVNPNAGEHGQWRPANTMPDWAIRHRRRVVSIDARQNEAGVWCWFVSTGEID